MDHLAEDHATAPAMVLHHTPGGKPSARVPVPLPAMDASATGRATRDGQGVATVHERLRAAILQGTIPAGETRTQLELARDLGVGRTPLREALRLLQREGLVVSVPNRRVRIAELSGSDAEELYLMRIALEAMAIRITVPALTSADLAELEGLMAQMDHYQRIDDRPGLLVPHRAFHLRLVAGAGPRITTAIEQLFDHAERYRLAFGAPTRDGWDQRRAEHRAILDAAGAGDAELAARLLAAHYAQTAVRVFAGIDPAHDLARLRTALASVAPGAESVLDG
jgi:DNA-binding GntR family transcriptional regulator